MQVIVDKKVVDRLDVGVAVETGGCVAVLTPKERKLLEHLATVRYGQVKLTIHDGQPTGAEHTIKAVRFG